MPGMDWDEVEKRLKEEALAEEIKAQHDRDAFLDKAFEEAAEEAFGGESFKDYLKAVRSDLPGVSEKDVQEALKIINEAKKLQDKGKTAAAASKLSHPKVRKVGKAVKKSKGCAVLALVLTSGGLAALAGLTWSAVEIVRALGH